MASPGAQEERIIPRPLTFSALPAEVKKEIISHCSQSDLICLSLVSKHFHHLAAAQLYRNFHIVFPDEEDPAYDCPIDGLAGGLDTFVTSEYNYAQHLRDLSLDTLSAGTKAEAAYKSYLAHLSCGKFMNTLLLLTLRKAKNLETFKWNIRVELSRPVFTELHKLRSLSHLHLRLQEGPSIYEAPPPLPFNAPVTMTITSMHPPHTFPVAPAPPMPQFSPLPPPNQPTQGFYMPPNPLPVAAPIPKPPKPRALLHKKPPASKEPPTLSGFKGLKSLAVLDIDTLDMVTEIKTCMRNSAGTLTKLKLSFSDRLAAQARKPPPEVDPEDSDVDDDFQVAPPPMPSYSHETSHSRIARALEERKLQESVLGRIFDVEQYHVKRGPSRRYVHEAAQARLKAHREFIDSIKTVSNKLMTAMGTTPDQGFHQKILAALDREARAYIDGKKAHLEAKARKQQEDKEKQQQTASSSSMPPPFVAETAQVATTGLFDQPESSTRKDKDVMTPEDIDVEAPEGELNLELPDPSDKDIPTNENTPPQSVFSDDPAPLASSSSSSSSNAPTSQEFNTAMANLAAQKVNFHILAEKAEAYGWQADEIQKDIEQLTANDGPVTENAIDEVERKLADVIQKVHELNREFTTVDAEIQSEEKCMSSTPQAQEEATEVDTVEVQNQLVSEYQRTTRGIPLKSLSIHLIPVKASVLSRAIDLRMLTRLTLLNVGIQAPIWAHLGGLNRESPLPLRKIYTDNVTAVFLTFVHELEEVHELFMLERDLKYKPEPFAPKTLTTIEHIRKMVLKKHIPFLRRLMIKNLADITWDLNERTIFLMDKFAGKLEELSCSMSIRVMHIFMQRIGGFRTLRALHIFQLRNEDTCVWVMRETKRFLIDNLSHYPELMLEWISIDDEDRVERIIKLMKRKKKRGVDAKIVSSKKGKQKESSDDSTDFVPGSWSSSVEANEGGWGGGSQSPYYGTVVGSGVVTSSGGSLNSGLDSDSDDDEAEFRIARIETAGDIHFYDVYDVRIFKKEIVSGRL
ncbi:hypothetical protein QBC43DRAFT_235769 [Cladorrhinum sp. PSN259]|nr:hypothetical protein QBC43DRAFT_235769 [Cladorrhinum sp. PSN259]